MKIFNKIKYGFLLGSTHNSTICKDSLIHPTVDFINSSIGVNSSILRYSFIDKSIIGNYCKIYNNSYIFKTSIDDYSYINMYSTVMRAKIKKFTSIASHVYIGPTPHPLNKVATHPFIFLREFGEFIEMDDLEVCTLREQSKTEIGNDVWIGQGVTIMPNIKIDDGAVVGAGSVVTKNVGAYEVVAGVPAKLIKKRFNEHQIEKLKQLKWWEWQRKEIISRIKDFNNIDVFIEKYWNEQ